jgi:hydroxyethylthiazole kinase-like uncharacterized protein yjeF
MEELLEKIDRDPESHKGQNGKVGVIAGSRDYTGAPALVAKAALRTGCDLTRILTSDSVRDVVASYSENFIVSGYDSDYFDTDAVEKALEIAEWSDAVVIGPGLGQPDPEAVREFLGKVDFPVVIDADALEHVSDADLENAVLTPHSAEYNELGEEAVHSIVERGNVVVKKGHVDKVISSEGEEMVEAGNSAMTVGGTGDVLTGVIAAFIAKGLELEEATKLGVWLNGKAGEKAEEEFGKGILATDLIEELSSVITED